MFPQVFQSTSSKKTIIISSKCPCLQFAVQLWIPRKCIQKTKSCPVSPHSWSSGSRELQFVMLEVQVRWGSPKFCSFSKCTNKQQKNPEKRGRLSRFHRWSLFFPWFYPFPRRKEKVESNLPQDQSARARFSLSGATWRWRNRAMGSLYPIKLTYRLLLLPPLLLSLLHHHQSNQIKSKQVKSNQIKSSSIKSNKIKSNPIKSTQIIHPQNFANQDSANSIHLNLWTHPTWLSRRSRLSTWHPTNPWKFPPLVQKYVRIFVSSFNKQNRVAFSDKSCTWMYQFFRQVSIRSQEKREWCESTERHVDWIIWQAYSHIRESVVFIRTYTCQCQFHYLTTFPKTNNQQLPTCCAMTSKKHPTTILCHLQAQVVYLYSCHFQHLSPQQKIIQPTKKKTPPPQLQYLDFPPFLDFPFWHLLVLPLLQAPFPPRATASPPPRGPQQWLEPTRFRRPAEASWLQASLGSRSSRGKMRLALKSEGLSMYYESTK